MILSHKIRLVPNKTQQALLRKACGVARYTWNWALAKWRGLYEKGEKPKASEIKKLWNQEKPQWVYESPKDANQRPFTNLQKAFVGFFKKISKYPQFKKKGKSKESFYVSNDKAHIQRSKIKIPKIGWVKLREELRFEGKIMSFTVSCEAPDKWFVSISIEVEDYQKEHGTEVIGLDLGVKTAIVCSDGQEFQSPKPLKTLLKKIKRTHRKLSRRKKGSNRREKAKKELQNLYWKSKNQRLDFIHKTTSSILSKAKMVCIEDLNVKGMMKNHRLSRAISDIGFYEIRRQLEYKSKIYGNEILVVDRFFPSSKTCNSCGLIKDKMPLSERVFTCECGYTADRDVNAANNLRTLGLRETNARGQKVRPKVRKRNRQSGRSENLLNQDKPILVHK